MTQDTEAPEYHLSSVGVTRRASVSPTITSNTLSVKAGDKEAHFPETQDSASEHTIAQAAQAAPKTPNLFVVFSGLQIALFLAALDG